MSGLRKGSGRPRYLQFVLEEVFLVREFAIHAKQALLVCGQRLKSISMLYALV